MKQLKGYQYNLTYMCKLNEKDCQSMQSFYNVNL